MDTGQTNGQPQRETFEAVIARFEAALLRYATRIVHDPDAAQDVVQNTFIRLCRFWKPDLYNAQQLSTWLYRITHNCAIDYLRKETRHRTLLSRHADEHQVLSQDTRTGPDTGSAADLASQLLKRLSLREQQLVVLKIYEEKSYREISEITELSEGNVGYIIHHAMKKLGKMLKEERERNR